jgi:hypothetical protein
MAALLLRQLRTGQVRNGGQATAQGVGEGMDALTGDQAAEHPLHQIRSAQEWSARFPSAVCDRRLNKSLKGL